MESLNHLAKRECVSNCVVPLCSSIQCSSNEICILSSQTCSSCPSVSCVALSLTDTKATSSQFPKGAIAGIVVALLVLLSSLTVLIWKLKQRRQTIREISEKASLHYSHQDPIYETDDVGSSDPVARFPSNASIQIGLGTSIAPALATSSRAASPLPLPNDHFFSADELLRMSYAESVDGRTNSATHKTARISGNDGDAAIMQANNPVLAVRARAAVLQLTKRQSAGPSIANATSLNSPDLKGQSKIGGQQSLVVERLSSVGQPKSFWEEESVTSSPVERDLISPDRFEAMNSTSPTKSTTRASRLSDHGTPTRSSASNLASSTGELEKQSCPQISTQVCPSAALNDSRASETVDFDWLDPAIFKIA